MIGLTVLIVNFFSTRSESKSKIELFHLLVAVVVGCERMKVTVFEKLKMI